MERELIFNAALKLIKEGRFEGTPLSEIAFHAQLTESTTSHFFGSRFDLIAALAEDLRQTIHDQINSSIEEGRYSHDKFFKIWINLCKYYVRNPEVIPFIEQCDILTTDCRIRFTEKTFLKPLVEFFETTSDFKSTGLDADKISYVFHGSVVTAAKITINSKSSGSKTELRPYADLLWNGLTSNNDIEAVLKKTLSQLN